ncbi:MAG: VRR-NUC domain-containing protein [Verrucomicrobiales bacterium]|nr:VRR-NUC domain-containing protein [Verrucomicrobiales bacterium]
MSPKPAVILKSRYYLDHFEEMLDFILTRYQHALDPKHLAFAESFQNLSLDARCLYVRMVNRKGHVFVRDYLRYEEIHDTPAAVAELRDRDFILPVAATQYEDLLRIHTRDALAARIRQHDFPLTVEMPRSNAKKAELIQFTLTELPFEELCAPGSIETHLAQGHTDELGYFLFLYFGDLRSGLADFALRDLGVMKTQAFKQEFKPRFNSRVVALAAYRYRKLLAELTDPGEATVEQCFTESPHWPRIDDPDIEILRGRALNRLGAWFERHEDFERALAVHQLSDQFPSTERTVRLLMSAGRAEEAAKLLGRLIEDPSCDQELLFAEDFYERKFEKKKVGRLTALLREAPVLPLDESGRNYPEGAAIRKLQQGGAQAWHTENVIWGQLFGLIFWDLLFTDESAAVHTPFDRSPQDLHTGQFYHNHRETIDSRLEEFSNPGAVIERIRQSFEEHDGSPNHFVIWSPDLLDLTCRLVRSAPKGALSHVLREMSEQWQARRNGFPDLMVIKDDQVRFAEIKAEGDSLRRNQLAQLDRLKRAGFPVEVLRVEWIVDPDQDYVVVDVETTGGNAQWNRVTEIGAVRVRNGKIIEEWSSLINPQRRIPGNIVSLTGITDDMVADAPLFADIADGFREFLDGAVFVAHRAKFDYSFIKGEYERIGEELRCPTLCTVVESRRHFPGQPSYSLANLSAHFEISLESHHRALCDARATAEILLKINEKRLARQK